MVCFMTKLTMYHFIRNLKGYKRGVLRFHREIYHIHQEIQKQFLFLILGIASAKIRLFPSNTIEKNNLDQELENSKTLAYLLTYVNFLKFTRSSTNSIYNCQYYRFITTFNIYNIIGTKDCYQATPRSKLFARTHI